MERQVRGLDLCRGASVLDLGSGTGDFAIHLSRRHAGPTDVRIHEVDFVADAMDRAEERLGRTTRGNKLVVNQYQANLDLGRGVSLPFVRASFDAAIISLLISYLEHPGRLLRELLRVTRPGGRVVISSLRRDADISKLLADGLAEYRSPSARESLGAGVAENFDAIVRSFLNDASRILDLEEQGRFRFWDPDELRYAVSNAGFERVESTLSLGEPAQAVIVTARRP